MGHWIMDKAGMLIFSELCKMAIKQLAHFIGCLKS